MGDGPPYSPAQQSQRGAAERRQHGKRQRGGEAASQRVSNKQQQAAAWAEAAAEAEAEAEAEGWRRQPLAPITCTGRRSNPASSALATFERALDTTAVQTRAPFMVQWEQPGHPTEEQARPRGLGSSGRHLDYGDGVRARRPVEEARAGVGTHVVVPAVTHYRLSQNPQFIDRGAKRFAMDFMGRKDSRLEAARAIVLAQ